MALNAGAEMQELAAKSGFEPLDVGIGGNEPLMRERSRIDTGVGRPSGLGRK